MGIFIYLELQPIATRDYLLTDVLLCALMHVLIAENVSI